MFMSHYFVKLHHMETVRAHTTSSFIDVKAGESRTQQTQKIEAPFWNEIKNLVLISTNINKNDIFYNAYY